MAGSEDVSEMKGSYPLAAGEVYGLIEMGWRVPEGGQEPNVNVAREIGRKVTDMLVKVVNGGA